MKQFEVGKTYTHGYAGDHNLFKTWTVTARSRSFITIMDSRGDTRRRKVYLYGDVERVLPLGNYSMAPVLSADKEETA